MNLILGQVHGDEYFPKSMRILAYAYERFTRLLILLVRLFNPLINKSDKALVLIRRNLFKWRRLLVYGTEY